jgi:isopenicillin N synthase-like dioxygenase
LPPDTYELYGDNQWPDDETIPGFSATYIEYCARVLELCRRMIRIFALALDVPEDYFDSKINNPGVISRMMHYPAQPVGDQREGLGAHTVRTFLPLPSTSLLTKRNIQGLRVLYYTLSGCGSWTASLKSQRRVDFNTAYSRYISCEYRGLFIDLVSSEYHAY